jgi:uncharacterized protein
MLFRMIHKFNQNGYKIALDVNSGSVHILDSTAYDLLDFADENMEEFAPAAAIAELSQKYSLEALDEAWAELYSIYSDGQLFTKDNFEKYQALCVNSPIKAMCLNISHDCNLRCKYCFASTGDFGEGRKLMPFEVGKKAIDFLIENSGTRHNLEVDFFGGEPLMNFEVVKQITNYARSIEKQKNKNIRFTITTNGLLLDDDKIDFINSQMSNVVLSIDGRKEINDQMRIRVDGTGSYDEIMKNYKKLCEKREYKNYYVRGTFTAQNLDFVQDVLHLANEGFDQISVEPVISEDDKSYALKQEDLPRIFEEYDVLAETLINRKREGRGFNFFHFMIDLEHGPCAIKLLRGCGCGNEYVAITPDGDIYPCHQFVGQSEWKMGNVMETQGIFKSELKDKFAKANIYTKEDCNKCWARFFCSGGCNANNSAFMGDILKPMPLSCEIERKRIECSIMIKASFADVT